MAGAVLGLTDVDALTISMTTTARGRKRPAVAAEAIAIGILANCLMKLVLAVALGAPRFARTTATMLAARRLRRSASQSASCGDTVWIPTFVIGRRQIVVDSSCSEA